MNATLCEGSGRYVGGIRVFGRGYFPTVTAKCEDCGRWVPAERRVGDSGVVRSHAVTAQRSPRCEEQGCRRSSYTVMYDYREGEPAPHHFCEAHRKAHDAEFHPDRQH